MAKENEKEIKKPKLIKKPKKDTSKEKVEKKETVEKVLKEGEKTLIKPKKSKKYNTKEAIIIMILSIIIGVLAGSVITKFLVERKEDKDLYDFNDVYRDIKENSYNSPNRVDLYYSSLAGLLGGLNDRYAYLDESKMAIMSYEEEIEGQFVGLGININVNENGEIVILSIFPDSPAEKAGLMQNDIITKIDGKTYGASNYEDFSYNIKTSKKGRTLTLEVSRENETLEKEITLDKVEIQSSSYYVKEVGGKKIGVFIINNYANNTYDQFYKNYNDAIEEGIEGIVLDLRCNAEGDLDNAAKIASLFLEKDTVIYQFYKNGTYDEVKDDTKKEINLPVVVLINGGTIAGGELIASTLNENINAPIVGSNSYGKGTIQKTLELSNGRLIKYTIKEWVTSKKNKVDEVGIKPTYEIADDLDIDSIIEQASALIIG